MMVLENAERMHLERQVTLARVIFAALALVDLVEFRPPTGGGMGALAISGVDRAWASAAFLAAYVGLALAILLYERGTSLAKVEFPLLVDFVALVCFLFLSPSLAAWWFLFLFLVFALSTRGNSRAMLGLVCVATVGIIIRIAATESFAVRSAWQQFLEKLSQLLQFDRGLTESVRQALGEIALAFNCEQACFAIRDEELERLFVWKIHPNEHEPSGPETLALSRSETFLTDSFETSFAWEFEENGPGRGFGWDRRTGQAVRHLAAPPSSTRHEFGAHAFMAVTIDSAGKPAGRVLLLNPKQSGGSALKFTSADLRWLEQIVRHIALPLENVFLMRHLRARAIESERSRISRDLHDGILQTLLSLNIQLDVLRHKFPWAPEQAGSELETLQKTVQQESEELRRMVTDLRPLRVESADMRELMLGFAERFRNESGLAVDLFIEDRSLRMPDRICRELFQIYRESLNNIKKHAKASHVVVKLGQDEAKVSMVVDDNGHGFSFSGNYASEDLDRLRLGPISIKERTRSVGGTLTVESNPGHGARLTVEIPLN